MVSLYFGHVSLHSSALPIPVNQTPKLTEILCLQMLCLPCAFLSYSGVFPIPAFLESCKPNEPLQNYFSYRYVSKGTLCGLSCSCRDVVHLTWAAPSTEASTKPDITTPDRLSPTQISFPAAGTHRNGITIIDSADEPEEYMGPQERSHSFVSAYVMHCLNLPATLSSCSALGLPTQVQINVQTWVLN